MCFSKCIVGLYLAPKLLMKLMNSAVLGNKRVEASLDSFYLGLYRGEFYLS